MSDPHATFDAMLDAQVNGFIGKLKMFRRSLNAEEQGMLDSLVAMASGEEMEAVQGYATRFGLAVPDLDRRALQWAQLRGGRSGRVAWQFICDLAGEQGKPLPL